METRLCNLLATNDEQDAYIDSLPSRASCNTPVDENTPGEQEIFLANFNLKF
jgi:hypothetical protein